MDASVIYLTILIGGISLGFAYLLFSELAESLFKWIPVRAVNPVTFIGFITLFGGFGYAGQAAGLAGGGLLVLFSLVLAGVIIALVHVFFLQRLRRS
ncbi:hypothetical protein [Alkalicoccus chagannorensis]|uniref:hypothetical protein n=1 Tax=Alkalicoccus chagannorensis TaxID=427072 RepID=UPI000410C2C7|nr:hypothetical protein [Alkalicoccus chagannorensis]